MCCSAEMTRKTYSDTKDEGAGGEGRDYMKLKTILEEFVGNGCRDYDDDLDALLIDTAKTGIVRMPWKLLKPVLRHKLDKCLNETFGCPNSDDEMHKQLGDLMDKFEGPPFTIQRLCELLLDPLKHYKRKEKYMRALEKNLLVVSTQEPDLVWMKIPKLSQLLEVKPKPLLGKCPSLASPDPMLDKEPVMPTSPTWKVPRPQLSPRSRTPPPDFDHPNPSRNWEGLFESARDSIFPRKRSSSFRRDDSVELQEADSTVSDSLPMESPKKHRMADSEETDIISALLGNIEPSRKITSCKEEEEEETVDDDSLEQSKEKSHDVTVNSPKETSCIVEDMEVT